MTSTQRRIVLANITLYILIVVVAWMWGDFRASPPDILRAPFDAEAAGESQQQWADYSGVEPSFTNTVGMEFRLVPPGEFKMGSAEFAFGDGPQHRVRITEPFWLGVYEVTQAQWVEVTGKNPSWFVFLGGGSDAVVGLDTTRFPVESVNWYECVEYCNALSRHEHLPEFYQLIDVSENEGFISRATVTIRGGAGYRLPTEAEWEYACRAGTATAFHFGVGCNGREANVDGFFPFNSQSRGPGLMRTTSVGSYTANQFGIFDLHGNVAEWCFDFYDLSAYTLRDDGDSVTVDPLVIEPQPGSRTEEARVLRGASWVSPAMNARSESRRDAPPTRRDPIFGFRVARTLQ